MLWERDGRTPGEIAAAVNVTTPAVTKVATRMSEAGLLVRRRDDRDHRLVRLWLTDAGRALQEPIEAERRLMEEKLTADLTETERERLMKALAKIHLAATDLLGSPIERDNRPSPGPKTDRDSATETACDQRIGGRGEEDVLAAWCSGPRTAASRARSTPR